MTLTTAILLLVILSAVGFAAGIVGRHVPAVAGAPEFTVNQVARRESVVRKIALILLEQYRRLSVTIVTRALRRLKIILLKTDNVASKLLLKIRSYEETLR